MGVVKRIAGWRMSGWPIPQPLLVLVGLAAPRDPEAYLEARRAAREAARERRAIQEEGRPKGPGKRRESRPDLAPDHDLQPPSHLDADRAAPGWYRIGSTFYPIGQGPRPTYGLATAPRPPATHQGLLF